MPADLNRLEVERIRNLVSGFGWEVVREEVTDEDIIIALKKKRVVPSVPAPGPS